MRERATVRGAYLVKRGWWGSRGRVSRRGLGCGGGVGEGGCIVVAEFGVKGLHFLHADIVSCAQLELVHGGRWVEIDVVGEGVGL